MLDLAKVIRIRQSLAVAQLAQKSGGCNLIDDTLYIDHVQHLLREIEHTIKENRHQSQAFRTYIEQRQKERLCESSGTAPHIS